MASRLLFVPVRRTASAPLPDGEVVAEEAQLRRRSRRHQDDVGVAVAVEVEDGEGAAVLVEVESALSRDLVEAAVAVVAQQDVALVAGLRPVPHQQPVGRPPRVVVRRAELARERRSRRHLAPEEAVDVDVLFACGAREHAVHDVEILEAVVVEVERVGGPGPAAEFGARLRA